MTGVVIRVLFEIAQMNTVLKYVDVFYNKKYLLEKEVSVEDSIFNG